MRLKHSAVYGRRHLPTSFSGQHFMGVADNCSSSIAKADSWTLPPLMVEHFGIILKQSPVISSLPVYPTICNSPGDLVYEPEGETKVCLRVGLCFHFTQLPHPSDFSVSHFSSFSLYLVLAPERSTKCSTVYMFRNQLVRMEFHRMSQIVCLLVGTTAE